MPNLPRQIYVKHEHGAPSGKKYSDGRYDPFGTGCGQIEKMDRNEATGLIKSGAVTPVNRRTVKVTFGVFKAEKVVTPAERKAAKSKIKVRKQPESSRRE